MAYLCVMSELRSNYGLKYIFSFSISALDYEFPFQGTTPVGEEGSAPRNHKMCEEHSAGISVCFFNTVVDRTYCYQPRAHSKLFACTVEYVISE